MKRYELLALVLLVSHAFSASVVPESDLEDEQELLEPVEGFDLSTDGAFENQHTTRLQTDGFLLESTNNFGGDFNFAESRVGPGPFQILVHDLDSQDDDAVVETIDERNIPESAFSFDDTFEPISNAFDPLREAVQPVTAAYNQPIGDTVVDFAAGTKKLLGAKAILAAPFAKAGAFLAAPFVKVGAKKIALIMKGGVVVGAKLLKGAALKTKIAATKAGLGAALLGKKAVIFGSGAALKGGLATGLATAAGAPLVLVPAGAAAAASKFFPQLKSRLGTSLDSLGLNFNLFAKATPEVVEEEDQMFIMEETEDGQTILIPASGANAPTIVNLDENADFNQIFGPGSSATNINCAEAGSCLWIVEQTEDGQTVLIPASGANAPSIVNLDANLGGGTNTVIVDADSLSSINGRMGSRSPPRSHHTYGGQSVEVDSVFLNQLLSAAHSGQRYGQAGHEQNQPIRRQPIRKQPIRHQPIKHQPIEHQPTETFQPIEHHVPTRYAGNY